MKLYDYAAAQQIAMKRQYRDVVPAYKEKTLTELHSIVNAPFSNWPHIQAAKDELKRRSTQGHQPQ